MIALGSVPSLIIGVAIGMAVFAALVVWRRWLHWPRLGLTNLKAGSIFILSLGYLAFLIVLLVGRKEAWNWVKWLPDPIGGIVPLAVPWFGALGAVMISLYGVFAYNGPKWDNTYNYWHIARPLVGAVLGTIAFMIFVGLINATGADPQLTGAAGTGSNLVPYFVLAFVVGFREETFRQLVKRAVDILLGPGIPGATPPAAVSVTPSPIDFGEVAVSDSPRQLPVKVANMGSGNLFIDPSTAAPPGVELTGDGFSLATNAVTGGVIQPNSAAMLTIQFHPAEAKDYTGKVTIHSTAGTTEVEVRGKGRTNGGG